jgi:DNA polymerase-3 subunit delta'
MARLLDFVIGHKDIIEKMMVSFEQGKPGQTFLFVGPDGIGKKLVAKGMAQALLCPKNPRGCGLCPSCFRISQGNHEGYLEIAPEGANIKMEQGKQVISFLNLRSISHNRVILIDQAQTLNAQTANSLLKTLEEPPEGTFFFLIAPSVAGVLPTIRSRSRVVQFKPLKSADLARKVEAPAWALKSAAGSFEKLKQLQEGPELEVRQTSVDILNMFLKDSDFLLNDAWRTEVKDRQQAQRLFSYWVGFVKDAIIMQEDLKDQMVNVDQNELVKTLAEYSREFLLDLMRGALSTERAFGANRDSQLVVEEYFISMKPQLR